MADTAITNEKSTSKVHSLGMRLAINLTMVGFVGLCLILTFVAVMISSRFEVLENSDIEQNIGRTERLLTTLQNTVRDKSLDWSLWTATYDFINDRNEAYRQENLTTDSFFNLNVEAVAFVGLDGESRFTAYYDFEEYDIAPELTAEFEAFATTPEYLSKLRENEHFQGFVRIADRLLVVSFSQVQTSEAKGETNGYLVFASELNNADMAEALQVPAMVTFRPNQEGVATTKTDEQVLYSVNVSSVLGAPLAALEFQTPRDLRKTGRSLLQAIGLGIASMILATVFVLYKRLDTLAVQPLSKMEKHVSEISQTGELKQMPEEDRYEEIGKLTSGFNEMAQQLQRLRSKLEIQSYELGRTQNSIDIMHNIRNGLSPIGPIMARLSGMTQNTMHEKVDLAFEELASNETDPGRRAKLLAFLKLSYDDHSCQMEKARDLIGEVDKSVLSALAAIEQTQDDVDSSPETMAVGIKELITHNLNLARFANDDTIEITLGSLTSSIVETNRVLFGQALNNVLSNAAESIVATGRDDGNIHISGEEITEGDAGLLRLVVKDNGEGFDPAMSTRLFERGYSTRPDRTGGKGLHWSANSMKSLGGSIAISSKGKGQGATVEMILPLASCRDEAPDPAQDGFQKAS